MFKFPLKKAKLQVDATGLKVLSVADPDPDFWHQAFSRAVTAPDLLWQQRHSVWANIALGQAGQAL